MKIHIGYEKETGEPVEIEMGPTSPHIAIFGQTGLGKTVLVRRIMAEIPKDYRILAFDTREGVEEFRGAGRHVPVYIQESTDALVLKGLLETKMQSSLKREYATLVRVSQDAEDWDDIIARLTDKINDKKTHAIVKDMCVLLRDLLQRLKAEMQDTEMSDDVVLEPGLNVMSLNDRSKQFKQLAVRAVLPLVYRKYRKLVVFLDEGQEFIPQKYSSAAKEAVDDYIRTARGKEDYMVIAAQSITSTDKDPLKQCHGWVLFGQATRGEAEETIEYIPHTEKLKLTKREIQTMPMGFAIVSTKSSAKRTYVQPTWIDEGQAVEVATGHLDPKDIIRFEKKVTKHMDDEERKHLKGEIQKWANIAEGKDTELNSLAKQLEEAQFDIKTLKDELELTKSTRQVIAREVIRENLGKVFPDLPQKVPAIVEGDIDLDTLAAKLIDMATPGIADAVEARILAKIPKGQKIEVPPPRVVLTKLLQDEVDRIKAKISALNVMQKKMLAYVAAKKTTQKYSDVQKAVAGYVSGPYRELLVTIRDTGLMTADTQHSTVRYAGRELVEQDLRGRYDLTDEDVQAVVAAIENEFAHMLGEIR